MNVMCSDVGFWFCFLSFSQDEETKPAIGNEENGINIIESAPQEQTNNDNLICADRTRENDTNGYLVMIYQFVLCLNKQI